MIIPGMAFDSLGNRLGRGRGFYDRMLKRFPAAYKIGVAFSVQHAPSVPIGLMDVPMDSVLFA
jgi:5-formyltetrahydrofolate cyclo-ligase